MASTNIVIARHCGSLPLAEPKEASYIDYSILKLKPDAPLPKLDCVYQHFKNTAERLSQYETFSTRNPHYSYEICRTSTFRRPGRYVVAFRTAQLLTWFTYDLTQPSQIYFNFPIMGKVLWYNPENAMLSCVYSRAQKMMPYTAVAEQWRAHLLKCQKMFADTGKYPEELSDPFIAWAEESQWYLEKPELNFDLEYMRKRHIMRLESKTGCRHSDLPEEDLAKFREILDLFDAETE